MFIEISVAVILLLFTTSILVTAIAELIAQASNARGRLLARTLIALIDDPRLRARFFRDGQVRSLGSLPPDAASGGTTTGWRGRIARPLTQPSSIPPRMVGAALVRALRRDDTGELGGTLSVDALRDRAWALDPDSTVRRALLDTLDGVEGTAGEAVAALETWYAATITGLSPAYRRRTQLWSAVIGTALAVILNLNLVTMVQTLAADPDLRAERLAAAIEVVEAGAPSGSDPTSGEVTTEALTAQAEAVARAYAALEAEAGAYGLGWTDESRATVLAFGWPTVFAVLSWILVGCATMLGAPFWFDLLTLLTGRRRRPPPRSMSPN